MEQQHKVILTRWDGTGEAVRDFGAQGTYIKCLDLCEANRWTWMAGGVVWKMDIVEI